MIILSIYDVDYDADGDVADSAELYHLTPFTFREVVDLLRDRFTEDSESHGVPAWCFTQPETLWETGGFNEESVHPARDIKTQRRWAKAWNYARGLNHA